MKESLHSSIFFQFSREKKKEREKIKSNKVREKHLLLLFYKSLMRFFFIYEHVVNVFFAGEIL
jgi:hypothetical protein